MSRAPFLAVVFALAACNSGDGVKAGGTVAETAAYICHLGDHYESPVGNLFVISVQDEYRLIRCTTDAPIAGCYEDVVTVPRDRVQYNRWIRVDSVPGLELAIVSPTEVAFRHTGLGTSVPR